jgi:CRISPR/Cas system-associated exonuclease Cas4 (RecB family)
MNLQEQIDHTLEQKIENPRPHIGGSTLGHPCDRYLWLAFHWAVTQQFPGRLLRLFKRGQDEEASAIRYLELLGAKVKQQQHVVDFGKHVSGSVDGVITGLPGHELAKVLLEIKTHNKKSFNELEKKGVQLAKPMHYTQMQVYMYGMKLDRALYYAVCKDDDRLHTEIVMYDHQEAVHAVERGQRIAMTERMPEPIAATNDYYVCKMCPMSEFCHQTQCTKNVNCRTCIYAGPTEDSTWKCSVHDAVIPYNWQLQGCEQHALHSELVPWPMTFNGAGLPQLHVDGKQVVNGVSGPGVYSSREILADPALCASADPTVEELRSRFNATIVEAS